FHRLVACQLELADEFGQLDLASLDLGNISVDGYNAALPDPPFAYPYPAIAGAMDEGQVARAVMRLESRPDPPLGIVLRFLEEPPRGGLSNKRLERRTGRQEVLNARVELLAETTVAENEPVLGVEQGEAFRDALDRIDQALSGPLYLAEVLV